MEKQLDADNNPYDKEMCDEDVCWYDWLDPQHNYTVYTIPGGGWLNYMTILSEINLSKFDQCIIQETFETRMFFHCDDAFRKVTRNNLEVHYGEVDLVIQWMESLRGCMNTSYRLVSHKVIIY